MCKVSVIVPVYNGEKYLRACLKSLAAQTLEDIEIIVINDGSTDGSLAIAEEFVTPPRSKFRVFTTENRGSGYARNYGASLSKGSYLIFVDSDDLAEPDYCKALYEKAQRDDNDLVVCRVDHIVLRDGKQVSVTLTQTYFEEDNYRLADKPELLAKISTGPWNKLIKRELFFRVRFDADIRFTQDVCYSVKAFCLARNIGTVKQILYHYYEMHNGITSRFGEERFSWILCMQHIYSFLIDNDILATYYTGIEWLLVNWCFIFNAQTARRIDAPWTLRVQFVKGMREFIDRAFPDWRNNPFYKEKIRKIAKAGTPYYDYCLGHLLFLIHLSRFVPAPLYSGFFMRLDRKIFTRWRGIKQFILQKLPASSASPSHTPR